MRERYLEKEKQRQRKTKRYLESDTDRQRDTDQQ